jgi:SAM-dependent methyltransferase
MTLEINYWNLEGHEPMLFDAVRCEAFRRAIAGAVGPGDAVLDLGAGTGILSVFAALAGARVVYAVERTHIADLARKIAAENGFGDRIRVLQGDMETLDPPEPVDLIVSEWLGGYGVDENLLPVVVMARDRWLRPEGRMVPGTVEAWMAPAFDPRLQEDLAFWYSRPYGVELSPIGRTVERRAMVCCNQVKAEHLRAAPRLLWTVDPATVSLDRAGRPFEARLNFTADRQGQVNALAAWFSADLGGGVILGNGPSEPDTHWGRTVFPIGEAVSVEAGTPMAVDFTLTPSGKGRSTAAWEVAIERYRFRSELVTVLTEKADPRLSQ